MSSAKHKIAKFTLPDNVQSFVVEEEPESSNSMEDYDLKPEHPVKTEPHDDPHEEDDTEMDEYLANSNSTPYAGPGFEPDVQAGAEDEVEFQTTQESTSAPAAPSAPIAPASLGHSMLQAKKVVQIGNMQTPDQLRSLQSAQEAFYAQMAENKSWSDSEQDDLENEEEVEDPMALERTFIKEKKIHEQKMQEGQLTQDEEMEFMKLESRYNKQRQELSQLDDIEDTIFMPEHAKSKTSKKTSKKSKRTASELSSDSENEDVPSSKKRSKKAKTTKSRPRKSTRKSQPSTSLNLVASTNNFWENAEFAQQMNDEPRVQGGRDRNKALAKLKKALPAESKAAAIRDGKRLAQAMREFTSMKNETGKNYSIETTDDGWRVRGMNVSLKNYQVVTAGWMRVCEQPDSNVKGGIIAHQMGLGKTVTCLANIVNGRPLRGQTGTSTDCATTLIVLPNWAMVTQWKSEILIHTMEEAARKKWGLGRVMVYEDNMKENSPKNFGLYDVVLTTYGNVRRSWPECKYPEGLSDEERDTYFEEHWAEKVGPLHKYKFLRVVLDEGHKIANPETQGAKACFRLKSDHRWILTGTPMANGAHDLYSLLCFIRHPSTLVMAFEAWKSQYCNPKKPMSLDALSHILMPHFSCWAHNDTFMNSVLVRLPKPRNLPLEIHQSILEHEIYEVFRERFKTRAQTLDEDGNVKSVRFHIFAMYTFLRQMTAHPLLVSDKVCDYLEMEDFDKLEKAVDRQVASEETPTSMIHALKSVMKKQRARAEARAAEGLRWDRENSSSNIDELDEGVEEIEQLKQPAIIKKNNNKRGAGGKHGKSIESGAFVECLKRSHNLHISKERSQCCKCERSALDPVMTGCYHVYCKSHYLDLIEAPGITNTNQAVCVKEECGKKIDRTATIDPNAPIRPRWLDAEDNVLPSRKTLAIKATVLDWLERDPTCKLIIFTQWREFLGMMARICEVEGWGYVTLHGGLKPKQKEENIRKFKESAEKQILIATLKTGGEGLNLTCANFVINVDPYWNTAAEIQAFSRVYRISQEKKTEFVNITLAGTIDEHLNRIKLRKKTEIDRVDAGHKKLSTRDMLKTFEAVGSISDDSTPS